MDRQLLMPPTLPQFALLCALRFVDPLTFTQIFPYINQLLHALRLVNDPANIGFYSGFVESTFAFFQLCSIYHWARLSDLVGRRPVVVATTFGLALATLLFGFASSLPVILLSRALAGICSGNAAVLHSILGELTNSANEAVAFSTYGLFWPLGSIIGPILGGALADPATYYPRLRFFQNSFFRDYPYFLPSFTTAFFAFVIGALALALLRETLPSKQALPTSTSTTTAAGTTEQSSQSLNVSPPPRVVQPPISLAELLSYPVLKRLALSGALLCFTATAFDAVFVLFCYTPVELGGLSFTSHQIATALALAGTSSILLQITILPPLLRRISRARLYTLCMLAWPLTYALVPLLNLIATRGSALVDNVPMPSAEGARGAGIEVLGMPLALTQAPLSLTLDARPLGMGLEGGVDVGGVGAGGWGEEGPRLTALATYGLWAGVMLVMVLSRVGCLAYSISLVLVKQNAPSPAALGKANGIVLWAMCLARAGAPAFVSSAFAWSTTHRDALPGGAASFAWLSVMMSVALAGCAVSRGIERAVAVASKGKGKDRAMLGLGLEAEEEEEGRGVEWEPVEAAREREAYVAKVKAWRERKGVTVETQTLLHGSEGEP
ncbi:MFS general substrate transporter [Pholiota conissans]|uniref:MFS general substrate transporter n=1 Tax=Pholiota conissans TaxID=109636 RepID=A0A9P5ZBJ1_9AGAR|nr:MFS general substrate transporter [Pholiota conissans]